MDKARFEKLLQKHLGPLERFIYYMMPSKTIGEDILQEVLLTAFENCGALQDEDRFKGWILKIAANKCNDFYRQRGRQKEVTLNESVIEQYSQSRYGMTIQESVQDTLEVLKETERQILSRYYLESLPQAEIARQLAIPLGTVKSRLHTARKSFRQAYLYPPPKEGEMIMENLPQRMPKYRLIEPGKSPFPVKWKEITGFFLVPRLGEKVSWAMYDFPEKNQTRLYNLAVTGSAVVHGVQGIEVLSREWEPQSPEKWEERRFIVQLTDTHFRMLAEGYTEDGIKHYHTFLDADSFLPNWGFGEDNCGREISLQPKGIITRKGSAISYDRDTPGLMDVTGRYQVEIGGRSYDTVLVVDIQPENGGVMTESYLDKNGRTVLWRRFNGDEWARGPKGKKWSERYPENERVTVNGEVFVHWYDCLTDHILK